MRLIISDLERNDKKQRPVQFWDLPETFKMKHRDILMWKSLISEDDFDNKSKSLPTTSLHHDATLAAPGECDCKMRVVSRKPGR